MKLATVLLAIALLVHAAVTVFDTPVAHAQAAPSGSIILLNVATSVSGCTWPTGATITQGMAICPINNSGTLSLALAANGGAFAAYPGAQAIGVTSFNGRTGAVVPTANDYTYAQLATPPSTQNCTTATQSNIGLVTSGCTFK